MLSQIESSFIVGQDIAETLEERFGMITFQQRNHLIKPSLAVKLSYQRRQSRTWVPDDFNLWTLDLLSKKPIPLIVCTESRTAWIRGNEKIISLVDKDGFEENALHVDYSFHDMTLTPEEKYLTFCL